MVTCPPSCCHPWRSVNYLQSRLDNNQINFFKVHLLIHFKEWTDFNQEQNFYFLYVCCIQSEIERGKKSHACMCMYHLLTKQRPGLLHMCVCSEQPTWVSTMHLQTKLSCTASLCNTVHADKKNLITFFGTLLSLKYLNKAAKSPKVLSSKWITFSAGTVGCWELSDKAKQSRSMISFTIWCNSNWLKRE